MEPAPFAAQEWRNPVTIPFLVNFGIATTREPPSQTLAALFSEPLSMRSVPFHVSSSQETSMDAVAVKERIAEMSPRSLARMAGAFQLLEAITAACGQVVVLGRLTVSDNPAATAANIIAHQQLFWLGFALSLLGVVFHIACAFLFYELFKPVDRHLSFLAMLVLLMATAVQALMAALYLGPSLVLDTGKWWSAFSPGQLQALAYTFLRLNGYAFSTHLFLFGLWCLLVGILICRSKFLPRVLGVLLAIAGLGWMIYLVPPVATRLFMPYIAGASALGEIPLEFWLIVMAVNSSRWREQALAAIG